MKTIFYSCLFLCLSTLCFGKKSAANGAPKFAPADGKKMLILGQDLGAVGGLDNYADGYVDQITDHIPAGVTSYTALPDLGGLKNLANWGAGDVKAQAYSEDATFDNSTIVIGLYLVNQLNNIASGAYDANIVELAQWVIEQERPVFLRIGYEFDGSWNDYNPEQFKKAWKQIVEIFDAQEVKNVSYVWQSAGINTSNIARWYLGDEYVNWLGYSHFDGPNPGQSIRNFAQQHDKPIMIAEATPRRDLKTGSGLIHWQAWYQKLFTSIYANDQIKALAYINADWDSQPMWMGQGWGDSRVHVNDYVQNSWLNEMAKAPWIMASDSLFDLLNYDAWINPMVSVPTIADFEEQIVLTVTAEEIMIRSSNQEELEALWIWDYSGKLCLADLSRQINYTVRTQKLPIGPLLIRIQKQGVFYQEQVWGRGVK